MKMVKSLLLGTAAGLVAMSGAQAADLPVKAKPVQYVKICSLYGAGFYYVPGTEMCLKIGGYVRQQLGWGVNGSLTNGGNVASVDTRATQNAAMRSRGYITADARNQTEYGTVRSYIAVGLSSAGGAAGSIAAGDSPGGATGFSANRAFIQFAGFTFGVTQSFYDFYSGPATSFWGGLVNPSSDTGDGGKAVTAYTMQFGGGFSASVGIEAQRNTVVIGPAGTSGTPVALPANQQRAMQHPDVVGNLRYDAPWGGAQIMGAIHDASGLYYGTTTASGHPSDELGWAIGAGVKLLTPFISPGDYFQAQVNYSQGAMGYLNAAGIGMYDKFNGGAGGSYGYGVTSDGVYGAAPGAVQLTTGWNVNAAYEHFWSKSWQTSVYGAYQAITYNATANANLCGLQSVAGWLGAGMTVAAGCNNNWQLWNVGSRTQWNVDSQTAMGVDIVYQRLETASEGVVSTFGVGTQPVASRTKADQGSWMGQFRIHRNFYP